MPLPKTSKEFRDRYYLKEELIQLCKDNGIAHSGSKEDLTNYLANFIDGEPIAPVKRLGRQSGSHGTLSAQMLISVNYSNDEEHRAFFLEHIGPHFKFNVSFMNWMKVHKGIKTYSDAFIEYEKIASQKKMGVKKTIDKQFEYNQYTRDFFQANPGLTREDCIRCWNFKKAQLGHHRYESRDLDILNV